MAIHESSAFLVRSCTNFIELIRYHFILFRMDDDQSMDMGKPPLVELPARQNPTNEPIGRHINTTLNAFILDPSNVVKNAYKSELLFMAVTKKKEFVIHKKGGKGDVVVTLRRKVLSNLLSLVCERHASEIFPSAGDTSRPLNRLGFDNGCALYTLDRVQDFNGEISETEIPEVVLELISGVQSIRYECHTVEEINLEGTNIADRNAIQMIDVLSWMRLDKSRHLHFGNKAYYTSTSKPDEPLGGGKVIKSGFEKSIRPIGGHLAIQIDSKVSPFFKGQKLMSFIEEICDKRDIVKNRQLEKQVRNLVVQTTHLPHRRIFEVKGFAKKSADDTTFEMTDDTGATKTITITEYFSIRLRYPDLPLVEERRGSKVSYHPIEVLEIVDGQRVNNNKSEPSMIADLIKRAQKKPNQLNQHIEDQRFKAYLDGSKHENLNAFGLRITSNQMTCGADELFSPQIVYQQPAQKDMKFAEKWRLGPRDSFTIGAQQNNNIYCIVFDRCMKTDDARVAISRLFECGNGHGMQLNEKHVEYRELRSNFEDMREFFAVRKGRCQAIIGFTRDATDCVHENLKLFEAQTGIVTLHCTKRVIDQVLQGKPLACGNIINKFNQKLGGVNFTIQSPIDLRRSSPVLYNSSSKWFNKTKIYFGLFVSHAGAQSFADRLAKVEQSEPTIVGISYSTKEITKQEGAWFMQQPGEQLIIDMVDHIVEAIKRFRAENKVFPEDIVVYRNGKSEGEFRSLSSEAEQFNKAFVKLSGSGAAYRPCLTIICVITGSNYRIFPKGNNYDNVNPGTCLDADGCHPFLKEFVLVSQRAILGTARPTRYTVVHESQGTVGKLLHIDELKLITNSLAYATGIVNGPISVPSPIDSAEKLANRGRNNYKAEINSVDDMMTSSSGPPPEYRHDGTEDFFKKLTLKFEPKLKNSHFWA